MSAAVSFNLALTMTSDWHIGSGVGRQGSVDSLVIRDSDDLPYAPSSTVTAMWRDAAEQLAFGLDERSGRDGCWRRLVPKLFGSQPALGEEADAGEAPTPSRLSLEHLRLPEKLRLKLSGPACASLRDALTFVKPGVRIDPRRGTAAPDMLRFEEVCRAGAVLMAKANVDTSDVRDADADMLVAFAFAALALLERIGGGRRRGLGRCEASISDVKGTKTDISNVAEAIEHLQNHFKKPGLGTAPIVKPLPLAHQGEIAFGVPFQDRGSVNVQIDITALSPLLVMDQRLGNATTCLDHIPGTVLLPTVARALREAGADSKMVTQLITSGALSVAPAFPMINGKRGLPMPLRWHWAKEDAANLGRTVTNAPWPDEEAGTTQKVFPKGGEVIAIVTSPGQDDKEGAKYLFRSVSHVARTHNTVADDVQKPTEDVGGVYTYEAIREGETLASVVCLPKCLGDEVIKAFPKSLEKRENRVGAAGRRGYGLVKMKAQESVDVCSSLLSNNEERTSRESAAIWLISDLCLPRQTGRALLSAKLQMEHALSSVIEQDIKVTRSWIRTRRHESWHRGWGLPRRV